MQTPHYLSSTYHPIFKHILCTTYHINLFRYISHQNILIKYVTPVVIIMAV